MEKELIYEIEELNISPNLKKELVFLKEKMKELEKRKNIKPFDIIIDNMGQNDLNTLLEYTTNILKGMGNFKDIIKYRRGFNDDVTNSIIVIDKIKNFESDINDSFRSKEKFINFFTNLRLNNNMIVFTCCDEIEKHLKNFDNHIFNPKQCLHLTLKDSPKDLYAQLISEFKNNNITCTLSYDFYKKLYAELKNNIYIKSINLNDYLYDYGVKRLILDNAKGVNSKTYKDLVTEKVDKNKGAKTNLKEKQITDLVGLENIKKELASLYNYLEFSKKIKSKNFLYLNLFFLGNPGTGKTTVARMYAQKLYELGFIKENKLVEIVPNDLTGEYVGHTREKTREILDEAKGGILFIDEAYLLYTSNYSKGQNPFMEEALVELVKYLEDPQNVVIFAGYPNEMHNIYKANPGLKSRIYAEISFADYTPNELYEILNKEINTLGLKIKAKSKEKIINYILTLKQDENFGNARSIKQLGQKMVMNYANRETKDEDLLLDENDLPKIEKENKGRMGFINYD